MTAVAAALAGAGLGLFGVLIERALASGFWPLPALILMRTAMVAGGLAALAAALLAASWRERLAQRGWALALAGAGGGGAAIAATGAVAARVLPEAGLGLASFPLLYVAALAAPFVTAGVALAGWCGAGERRRAGWFLAGVGAGMWCASLLGAGSIGVALASRTATEPTFRAADGEGAAQLSVDRGLRVLELASVGPGPGIHPSAGGESRRVLAVGLANGRALAGLLRETGLRLTLLEADAMLVRAALARWPELAQARADGRLTIVGGPERWALARLDGVFDLVLLGDGWSDATFRSRALSHRPDHRWTVEAFKVCLERLKPDGLLRVQRTGIPRVLLTLREATGLSGVDFGRRVAVFGRRGALGVECWYSRAGLESREALRAADRHAGEAGLRVVYTPADAPPGRNIYLRLVRGERPRGLAFTTAMDFSPPLDERPFFDHVERMLLSPRLPGMPEELEPLAGFMGLRIVPAADRALWAVLLAGLALAAAVLVGARSGGRRGGDANATLPRFGATALWHGAASGLLIPAFAAWSELLAPTALGAAAARAALLVGFGAAWALASRTSSLWHGWAPAAALALLFGGAGYRALPAAIRLGPTFGTVAVIAAGALIGAALGRALGALIGNGCDRTAGEAAADCGAALAAASLAAVAATLAAPHFGYPLLWVLGAVALLAPALRRAPGADGGGAATAT